MVIQHMKKMFHRIGAMAVALMMALSLAVPAMATTTTGDLASRQNTVKVNDAVEGAEYKLYKLLQLDGVFETKAEGDTQTKRIVSYRYSYDPALESTIGNLVKQDAFRYEPATEGDTNPRHGFGFKVDDHGVSGDSNKSIVTFITPAIIDSKTGNVDYDSEANSIVRTMMVEFADELRKLVDANSLTPFGDSVTATGTTVSFENVPSGYWMVTSNAGARSIVFTNPGANLPETMDVYEKNPAPTVDKKVLDVDDAAGDVTVEDGVASWQETNDAQIGDEVDFKITVELFRGAENIVVHDEMTNGLTFKELKGVKFYPRNTEKNDDGSAKFDRKVYELDSTTETTGPLELTARDGSDKVILGKDGNPTFKTDVATMSVDAEKHSFTLTFSNKFTNPATDDSTNNRDEKDPLNNVFLGDLSTLDDDGGKVEILYSATLNKDAVVNGDNKLICGKDEGADHNHSDTCRTNSNDNDAYVKYGHITGIDPGEDPTDPTEPPHESNHDDTKTYTYRFSIDKYVDGDANTKLAGAEFELRQNFVKIGTKAVEGQNNAYISGSTLTLPAVEYTIPETGEGAVNPIALVDITPKTEGYKGGNVYRVATPEEIVDAGVTKTTKIVTDDSGQITIEGLDSMLYSIKETAAPKGYIKLEKSEMMAIGSVLSGNGGKVFIEDKDATSKRTNNDADYSFNLNTDESTKAHTTKVGIANASGIQMPRTGGIGTTIFYVVGIALVFGAGVLLVVKKRVGRTED